MTLVQDVFTMLQEKRFLLATAESCTGGMIAASLTDIAGSSAVFERGFVTYSNQAKIDLLGVSEETLSKFGAVSNETAEEMVRGALNNSRADFAIAVTGIAGPSGGSLDKPVGLVYIGIGRKHDNQTQVFKEQFSGDRAAIRQQVCEKSFYYLLSFMKESPHG
jgi:nicotinamide-nucleotide amidase